MQTVTIPKQEYQALIGYKQLVQLEYEQPLSKELLKKLAEAKQDIESGRGVVLHSKKEIQEYFQIM